MEGNEIATDVAAGDPQSQDAPLPPAAVAGTDPATLSAEDQAALARGRQAIADDAAKVNVGSPRPQRPTPGRIVMYVIPDQQGNPHSVCPAVVTRVWSETCVNLRLLPDHDDVGMALQTSGMHPTSATFAPYSDGPDVAPPPARTWHWPPRV